MVDNDYWVSNSAVLSSTLDRATMLLLLQGQRGVPPTQRFVTASLRVDYEKVGDAWKVANPGPCSRRRSRRPHPRHPKPQSPEPKAPTSGSPKPAPPKSEASKPAPSKPAPPKPAPAKPALKPRRPAGVGDESAAADRRRRTAVISGCPIQKPVGGGSGRWPPSPWSR